MSAVTFALVILLNGAPTTVYFPSRDLCEAGARDLLGKFRPSGPHICIPVTGAATR